ncbi:MULTISPECIES: recombinase RecT [unclassified Pseudomonas]|uniref:recombinase RecT n=1 Tax=unclassified Pseudomonas TaxID=196821 RepID=UPI002448F68F|nr:MULTISPECIES: recombinase RecT [unclassified Pseudomonas]MDG9927452.1 recombinase RecT [Pseudomonas sp. GD04042]MDH0482521.1 recombinase RecT [Pseudomonas sp. GD04015]MDH0602873.1 recombinase RecT [Pseudomonas sp. GD03869]
MSTDIAIIEQDIYGARDSFASVLTDSSLNFEREAAFAIQAIAANDYSISVAKANRQSVVDAINNVAAIGISLNPAKKQAYLVPRDKKICLDISYIGLMDLAMATGAIRWAQAELVHSEDNFALNGFDKAPLHSYKPFSNDRGEVIGVYVVVKTADGDYLTETMSIADVNSIRDRSSAWKAWLSKQKSCPWVTDPGEMAKKTCVKRAYKYWPKTDRLEQAIHYLNTEGNEGLASLNKQQDSDLAEKWIALAIESVSAESLKTIWSQGLAEIKKAGDMAAYSKFKACVEKRNEYFKAQDANTFEGETA